MTRPPSRHVRDLARLVAPHGWTWHHRSGHVIFRGPDGKGMVVVSATPSDHRALRNTLAAFKHQGLDLKARSRAASPTPV